MTYNENSINFVAIDFETAHLHFPCEIGMAVVNDGKITQVERRLIKPKCYPHFHWYAKKIHGISAKDVAHEPFFDEVWTQLMPIWKDQLLIAHNASFDMGVIRKNCNAYRLLNPHNPYVCSINIAQKTWEGLLHYSLNALCEQEHIVFSHHHAAADAEACAQLVLHAMEKLSAKSMKELFDRLLIKPKRL